jgi:predicted hydrolase (HD superfamily)
MLASSGPMRSCGGWSACFTISTTSVGRTRPTIRCHPLKGAAILAERGYPAELIYAIKSHADYLPDCPRVSLLDKALYACDELAGFIVACAMVRPERLAGMEAKSVKKKLKTKGFAASINRDDITRGAADLGVDLDDHIGFLIAALAPHAQTLGLLESRL